MQGVGEVKIGIVGPCAAGKTTLANSLQARGYDAHDIAQEHSEVRRMWRDVSKPDVLIYLDVSLVRMRERLQVDWEPEYLQRLLGRLDDARDHAHFVLDTSELSANQVLELVLKFLDQC